MIFFNLMQCCTFSVQIQLRKIDFFFFATVVKELNFKIKFNNIEHQLDMNELLIYVKCLLPLQLACIHFDLTDKRFMLAILLRFQKRKCDRASLAFSWGGKMERSHCGLVMA